MPQTLYNPDKYLTSAVRALADYVNNAFDDDIVKLVEGFPVPDAWKTPIEQVVVHLELDDDEPRPVGFANGGFTREKYVAATKTTSWEEATAFHLLNFDVGIWAFQEAGGYSARLEVQETLKRLFTGSQAMLDVAALTNGVNVVSFSGGRHITDEINGQPVWRVVDMTLIVEVCGRRTYAATDAVDGFTQTTALVIDGNRPVTTP